MNLNELLLHYDNIKNWILESIPRDLKKFYNSLSIEEKEQLTDIAKKIYNGSLEFSLTDNSFIDNVKVNPFEHLIYFIFFKILLKNIRK